MKKVLKNLVVTIIILIFVKHKHTNTMKKLIVSQETFNEMLLGLIKSGVTFEANEVSGGKIEIDFLGGY